MQLCANAHWRILLNFHLRALGIRLFFCSFVAMPKEKKISVRTPAKIYAKLIQRAYDLNLNHREYFLALAMKDMELEGEGRILDEELAAKLQQKIKQLDQQK